MHEKVADLTAFLMNPHRKVTRKFLENRWDCSSATVHRILQLARKSGIPIVFENDRYAIAENGSTQVPGLWFSMDELAALLGLSHWLENLASGVLQERLNPIHTRLEKMLEDQGLGALEWQDRIRLLPMHFRFVDQDTLFNCARAVLTRKRTTFRYGGVKDSVSRMRNISPQTLVRYRDNWYLDGFDHEDEKLKAFALSRI